MRVWRWHGGHCEAVCKRGWNRMREQHYVRLILVCGVAKLAAVDDARVLVVLVDALEDTDGSAIQFPSPRDIFAIEGRLDAQVFTLSALVSAVDILVQRAVNLQLYLRLLWVVWFLW